MNVGSVVGGKYRIASLLGLGGMGSVWRADHLGLNAPVAIKFMDPALAGSAEALQRFHREAQSAAALRSPHVVQILDHGVDDATLMPFIVMELMEGESLADRLTRRGTLGPAETARVVGHVARALSRAHQAGIIHRDLKPDNIFLVKNDDEEIGKVLDFGIAKGDALALSPSVATQTGAVLGTPYYMSPEQISGAKDLDHRTDTWALAVIAFECLTGRRPFEADTIGGLALQVCAGRIPVPSAVAAVPAGFDGWFARAVAQDPAQRFQDARTLAEELRKVCDLPGAAATKQAAFAAQTARAPSHSGTVRPLARTWADDALPPTGGRKQLRPVLAFGLLALGVLGAGLTVYRAAGRSSEISGAPSSRSATRTPILDGANSANSANGANGANGARPIVAAAPVPSLSLANPGTSSPPMVPLDAHPSKPATPASMARAKAPPPVVSQPPPTSASPVAAPSATALGLRSIVGSRK